MVDEQATPTYINKVRQRRRTKRWLPSLLTHAANWIVLLFAIFPYYWAIISTLKPFDQLYTLTPTFWPKQITFSNYGALLQQGVFVQTLRNSLIVATITPLVAIVITSMTAYSLARLRYRY